LVPAMAFAVSQVAAAPRHFTADLVQNSDVRVSRYNDVVEALLVSGPDALSRFAEVAIALMIEAYEAELGGDASDGRRGRAEDAGWRAGTRSYVEQLRRVGASIADRPPIEMLLETHGGVRLVIGREQVMLNAPRLRDQAALERNIAEHVCRFSACSEAGTTVEERVEQRMAQSGGAWEFGSKQRPAYASGDGLRCVFTDRRHLNLKKSACIGLVRELRLLAEALTALKAQGETIDWLEFAIIQAGPGNPQKIIYSAERRYVKMHVPNLLHAETIWRQAIPWLRANVIGREIQYVIDLPDQLAYLTPTLSSRYESN
ncbi:MAG: hypothetical protein ACU85U_06710, partial [Gammaproteobacteria bacterium]